MEVRHIGTEREVCWDEALMDQAQGVRVEMHRPVFRNIALVCDAPWEGNICGYFTAIRDSNKVRLYYRGANFGIVSDAGEVEGHHPTTWCYAESDDGKTFHRVNCGQHEFWGQKDNNVILDCIRDNLYVFKDSNPDCPPEERYKGLSGNGEQELSLYVSADGVKFTYARVLADDGAYDSLNVAFWDPHRKQYYLYYRGVHGEGTENGKWISDGMHNTLIRDVRVRTSPDFVHWSEPQQIIWDPERDETELYTNGVTPYYRAPKVFIGSPMRYMDRYREEASFPYLPDWKNRKEKIRRWGRTGTVMTDTVLMTSRDGLHFRRTEEAFLTPGPERGCNWYYGAAALTYGMVETPSDCPGEPNEISIYASEGYRTKNLELWRYTVRLDGFFSWRGDYEPGYVLTKPFTFEGDHMEMNFATSAVGYVRMVLCDESGEPIPGYDSGTLFGDSVDRNVDVAQPVEALAGKTVRLRVELKDADLYSFRFTKEPSLSDMG